MSLFLLFCFFSFFWPLLGTNECMPANCSIGGPTIKFPFRIKNLHPHNCGYPGFDVFCNTQNETLLDLPSAVQVAIKSIDYVNQLIELYPPKYCLPLKLLPPLDLPSSPFHILPDSPYQDFQGIMTDYTLLNCSGNPSGYSCFCDGDSFAGIYSNVDWNDLDLTGCIKIGEFRSIYETDYYQFKWFNPPCGKCEAKGHNCSFKEPNTFQCIPALTKPHDYKKTGVTICSAVIISPIVVLICYSIWLSRENHLRIEKFLGDQRAHKPTRFSYYELKRITRKFSEKLGEGGYGTVYKGKLTNKIPVAVKVLNNSKGDGKEFVNEVSTIGKIHHINIVRLVGFCAQGSKRALVYEYLPNDSLQKFISQSSDSKKMFLGWQKLRDIAIGIAKGMEYLHMGCDQQILHFDIKPHNILLDKNFNPKICDFGLAKLCSKEQSGVTMTDARGTMGYIAPEVMSRTFGRASYKSDVYSFGMLLLEMVGGRENSDPKANTSQVYFPQWVYDRLDLNVGEDFWAQIEEGGDRNTARKLTIVGLWCIQWSSTSRPSMKEVVQMLEGDEDSLDIPPNPFPATNHVSRVIPGNHYQTELPLIHESEYYSIVEE